MPFFTPVWVPITWKSALRAFDAFVVAPDTSASARLLFSNRVANTLGSTDLASISSSLNPANRGMDRSKSLIWLMSELRSGSIIRIPLVLMSSLAAITLIDVLSPIKIGAPIFRVTICRAA